MKRAVIFSNGEYRDYEFYKNIVKNDDYVICADGAVLHCARAGIIPDLWIGDFDSCNFSQTLQNYPALSEVEIRKLNCRKDKTDTHVACDIACELGYDEIFIFGAFGKRIDHMLANISLLEYLDKKNIATYLIDEKNTISFLTGTKKIKKSNKYFSIIPVSEYITVERLVGAEYPLNNEKLIRCESRGVSNEIVSDYAQITLSEGKALIIESND